MARDGSGRTRGKEFFEDLSTKDQAKVEALFQRMGDMGEIRNIEKFRKEEGAIFSFKSLQIRLPCFFDGTDVVVTHGFLKKADRFPRPELERAKRIRDEHLAGKERRS